MTFLIFICTFAISAFGFYLDIYTTRLALSNPKIHEQNPRYRLPNGSADIPRLTRDKFILFGICLTVSMGLYFSGLSFAPFPEWIAFVPVFLIGVRHYHVSFQNYKNSKV